MLIRSQNREVLINFNTSVGIDIEEGPVKTTVASYVTGCSLFAWRIQQQTKSCKGIGHASRKLMQSTKYSCRHLREYLVFVLQQLKRRVIDEKKKEIREKAVFQMPEDSEVGIND